MPENILSLPIQDSFGAFSPQPFSLPPRGGGFDGPKGNCDPHWFLIESLKPGLKLIFLKAFLA